MCGISGFAYKDTTRPPDLAQLIRMRDIMSYRGPDDSGAYCQPGIALGSRRLAVLDLSQRGHMPMPSRNRRYWIAYNGEIYNFRELRQELRNKGHFFYSNTDTEVVLNGYIEEGPSFLNKLDGMFAIAIWDTLEKKLFLARDHIGIKPLYYHENSEGIYFASEQKSLFAAGISAQLSPAMWEELLCFGYVAGQNTPFKNMKRLLAGHYLVWDPNGIHISRWWNLSNRIQNARCKLPGNPVDWFRETFDKSVNDRRISDVPVGVLLSGGLDSTSIAASLAAKKSSPISSFTVRFEESKYDETGIAKIVARKYGLEYHDLYLDPKNLSDSLIEASWINDEPMLHASTPHLLAISKYAKSHATVLLSGEGSDEILGGYDRHLILNPPGALQAARFLPSAAGKISYRLNKLMRFSGLPDLQRVPLYNSCEIFPEELSAVGFESKDHFPYREKIFKEAADLYPKDLFRQSLYYDQHTFLGSILDRNDRMTMGASIECRVPFLDSHLMEVVGALPTSALFDYREGKHLLRKAVGNRLPKEVLHHKKWGFGVPWTKYLRTQPELRNRLLEISSSDTPLPVCPKSMKSLIENFLAGNNRNEKLIQRLFMVSVWHDTYTEKLKKISQLPQQEQRITSLQTSSN